MNIQKNHGKEIGARKEMLKAALNYDVLSKIIFGKK
jgi:hypothetical protein